MAYTTKSLQPLGVIMRRLAVLIILAVLVTLVSACSGAGDGNGNGNDNGDTTPPIISDVSATDISETSAVINWTTDEPCSYSVDYGLTSEYGATASSILSELVTNPSINLSGLSADTTYHYRVNSKDEAGNEAVSGDYTFSTTGPVNEIVTFPDFNLETVVRKAIEKLEGDIHQSDLERLTELDAWRKDITNLAGLEYCTSLTKLHLEDNRISDLAPLQNVTNLRTLILPFNQISDISALENLTSLTGLWLDWNQISDISPLQNLASLTELNLLANQISDISPLQNLTSLTELYLLVNQISDISPLQNLTSLTGLYLGDNQISDITSLTNLINLEHLFLDVNLISNIEPLVNNSRLSDGDSVSLQENPLSNESMNIYIPQLEARGVNVRW
jgi:Leucine-rich repeat (LRR) protein